MTEVRETKLPGVGVRHEFTTGEGNDMAVVVHHDGRRELMAYSVADPDSCSSLVTLSEHDTQTLAEILGVSHVTETVGEIRQDFDAMAIEWIELLDTCPLAHAAIGSAHLRTETGASIVAVIRDQKPYPSPDADFVLEAGDVVVAVGAQESLVALRALLGQSV